MQNYFRRHRERPSALLCFPIMQKTNIHIFGQRLRGVFCTPDDLPYPMRKALEALASKDRPEAKLDCSALQRPRAQLHIVKE